MIAKHPAPCIKALNKMRAFTFICKHFAESGGKGRICVPQTGRRRRSRTKRGINCASANLHTPIVKNRKIRQLSDSNRSRTLTIKTFYAIIQLHLKFKQKEKL